MSDRASTEYTDPASIDVDEVIANINHSYSLRGHQWSERTSWPNVTVLALAREVERLRAERNNLHDNFECERCGHNAYHPDGRCDEGVDGDEFCTFLICGRCVNEQHAREKRDREALRAELDEEHRWSRGWKDLAHRAEAERDELRERVAKIANTADVLSGYARHENDCARTLALLEGRGLSQGGPGAPCSCGFQDVFAAYQEAIRVHR